MLNRFYMVDQGSFVHMAFGLRRAVGHVGCEIRIRVYEAWAVEVIDLGTRPHRCRLPRSESRFEHFAWVYT